MFPILSAISFVFLATIYECSASTEYYEKGSNICLNFSKKTDINAIKKDNNGICVYGGSSFYHFPKNWGNRTFNCSLSSTTMITLCFENFQQSDAGLFSATKDATNNSEIFQNITLKIAVPVNLVTLTPAQINIIDGEEMNLTCTTSYCIPAANITWSLSSVNIALRTDENASLIRTVSSLVKNVVKKDHEDQVYCTASNIEGTSVKSEIHTINVLYKPEVSISQTSPDPNRITEGQTVMLECRVTDANPKTQIKWTWIKSASQNITLYDGSTEIYKIVNIERGASGKYSCIANNSVGASQPATINIDVLYKPEVNTSLKSLDSNRVIEGQSITLVCIVITANPTIGITWKWIKTDTSSPVLHNQPNYTIPNIERRSSGSYSCTAKNLVGESDASSLVIDVQYKPNVTISSPKQYTVSEGQTATLVCTVTDANPKTDIKWHWIKTDSPSTTIPHNGSNFTIAKINRTQSGLYNCSAENSVGTSEAATINVDVQYKPSIKEQPSMTVNESDKVYLIREIDSNPLSNASWYNGTQLLVTQNLVRTTNFTIDRARCTDTRNYTLTVSNTEEFKVTSEVELLVNCKPMTGVNNISLGVTDTTGIEFSATIIAYPQPRYMLMFQNSTINYQMSNSLTVNAVNNFTIHFNQTLFKQADFGTYLLHVNNTFGSETIFVNIFPQRKPDPPRESKVTCKIKTAEVKWTSSFNGGDSQSFTVFALIGQQEVSRSELIRDKGESKIHFTSVLNLQPSTKYVFLVYAQNEHGNSSSESNNCTTLPEESNGSLPLIAGGAAVGGISLAVIVIVAVFFLRRFQKHEKQMVKSQRLNNDDCTNEDTEDGLKENILYVSAGPRDNAETEGEAYAAVLKKSSKDDDNNANIYAAVKKDEKKTSAEAAVKSKKGFLKKGGKQKNKNGKTQRTKQNDVYENSEDIAMTPNADNVYSNTTYDARTDQEQRGYKNKDGLLYVEVQFDAKKGKENPVIHGEDEKTDYATVEFPMPTSSKTDTSSK